jgi:PEP-CTERM motif
MSESLRFVSWLRILGLSLAFFVATPAWAGPITIGDWYEFSFMGPGIPAAGCFPADPAGPFCAPSSGTPTTFLDAPPWTFAAPAEGASLTVTDAFQSGDRFEIFDFGLSIGLTSLTGGLLVDCGDDPVPCLANPFMSHGFFVLGPGNHSITIIPIAGETGGAYFRVDQGVAAVPEPGSWVALGLGLATLGVWRIGRSKARLVPEKEREGMGRESN